VVIACDRLKTTSIEGLWLRYGSGMEATVEIPGGERVNEVKEREAQ